MDIDEIAARAGVSRSTVSYAISGKRPISEATRMRIEAVMREADYIPNAAAQSLASGKSMALGLAIPPAEDRHLTAVQLDFIGALAEAAADRNHDLLLSPGGAGRQASFERMVAQRRVDGVIVMEVEAHDHRINRLERSGMPYVVIGRTLDPGDYDWVDIDFDGMVIQCVRHLTSLGRRHLALINRSQFFVDAQYGPSYRATRSFFEQAAAGRATAMSFACEDSSSGSKDVVKRILEAMPEVDGIVTINEGALPSLMAELALTGRTVPEDISVCGVVADRRAQDVYPALTGCDVPVILMAHRAVDMLLSRLGGRTETENELLSPSLTHRASTSKRPKATPART